MIEVKRILVPVDGSEIVKRTVKQAVDLAQICSAELELLYVSHLASETDSKVAAISWLPKSVTGSVKKLSTAILEQAAREIPAEIKYTVHTKTGIPEDVIVAYALENKIDLIVIGGRGLGIVEGFLLGSVSQSVLEEAKCPVVVVK